MSVRKIGIIGENCFGAWRYTRTACRGVVLRGDEILLSYETRTGQYMIPGGGLEDGEDEAECCRREVEEETGVIVEPGPCALEIDEYYEDWKYVSRYFLCNPVGEGVRQLTEREAGAGMEPRWVSVGRAVAEFATHADYADTDEMRRGLYLREYRALLALLMRVRPMVIDDYDRVYALWMSCKNMGFNDVDDSREGIGRYLKRNPDTCFVAEVGGALCGVILAGHDGRRGFIHHMAVAEAYRRQGVGQALVDRALAALEAEKISKVALLTFKYNEAGNAFWERQGFTLREDLNYRNRALVALKRIDT